MSGLRRELYRYIDIRVIPAAKRVSVEQDRKSLKLHGHQVAKK